MEEIISISALNQYVFCPRRCALMHVEGIWSDNEHTAKGTILHKNADERGYETVREAKCLHALPLYSEKYGLNGKADIVEIRAREIIPVEYKKGKRREFDNDNIQLAAQALCLEEMFKVKIKRGFIYHAASKRRREVFFDDALRGETIATIENVQWLLKSQTIPAATFLPRCARMQLIRNLSAEIKRRGAKKRID
ncbi:MAG TPA: CRISPR-associated protein Cas4 [Pyrinomonadaceae bacterium]|nr:CRISPR-associated protein Cas4 [Pyrinomonadaceae bacterium]